MSRGRMHTFHRVSANGLPMPYDRVSLYWSRHLYTPRSSQDKEHMKEIERGKDE